MGCIHDAFVYRARYHGVTAMLNERLPHLPGWPQTILEAIRLETLALAMWELRHQQVLSQLLGALAKFDIAPVLFKGTALAYDLYLNPVWRARSDTDIIISSRELTNCREVLLSQSFKRDHAVPGEVVSYQEGWTLSEPSKGTHAIDLHRRINNSELLSRLFTYDELRLSARPLPALCQNALATSRAHALLIACMHRATHKHNPYYTDGIAHYGGSRLIWLYDIHLLATVLTLKEWADVVRLAREKGLRGACLEGFEQTKRYFETRIPDFVLSALSEVCPAEQPAIYLNASVLRQQWMDFFAIDGLSRKVVFLKELIFPPEAYVRSKYAEAHDRSLAYLYARRAFGGATKRLWRDR